MTANVPSRAKRSHRPFWLLIPLLQLGFQISAKEIGQAFNNHAPFWSAFKVMLFNPWVGVLLACEIASLSIWMLVLSKLRLSAAFPMTAIGYVLVILTGWLAFGESIDALAVAGSFVILVGVWLIGQEEATE